jgi:hypothetical protein
MKNNQILLRVTNVQDFPSTVLLISNLQDTEPHDKQNLFIELLQKLPDLVTNVEDFFYIVYQLSQIQKARSFNYWAIEEISGKLLLKLPELVTNYGHFSDVIEYINQLQRSPSFNDQQRKNLFDQLLQTLPDLVTNQDLFDQLLQNLRVKNFLVVMGHINKAHHARSFNDQQREESFDKLLKQLSRSINSEDVPDFFTILESLDKTSAHKLYEYMGDSSKLIDLYGYTVDSRFLSIAINQEFYIVVDRIMDSSACPSSETDISDLLLVLLLDQQNDLADKLYKKARKLSKTTFDDIKFLAYALQDKTADRSGHFKVIKNFSINKVYDCLDLALTNNKPKLADSIIKIIVSRGDVIRLFYKALEKQNLVMVSLLFDRVDFLSLPFDHTLIKRYKDLSISKVEEDQSLTAQQRQRINKLLESIADCTYITDLFFLEANYKPNFDKLKAHKLLAMIIAYKLVNDPNNSALAAIEGALSVRHCKKMHDRILFDLTKNIFIPVFSTLAILFLSILLFNAEAKAGQETKISEFLALAILPLTLSLIHFGLIISDAKSGVGCIGSRIAKTNMDLLLIANELQAAELQQKLGDTKKLICYNAKKIIPSSIEELHGYLPIIQSSDINTAYQFVMSAKTEDRQKFFFEMIKQGNMDMTMLMVEKGFLVNAAISDAESCIDSLRDKVHTLQDLDDSKKSKIIAFLDSSKQKILLADDKNKAVIATTMLLSASFIDYIAENPRKNYDKAKNYFSHISNYAKKDRALCLVPTKIKDVVNVLDLDLCDIISADSIVPKPTVSYPQTGRYAALEEGRYSGAVA